KPLAGFHRANPRRERIARVERHVRDAAALHSILRTHGTRGKRVALVEAVLMRVGENEAAYGAMLGGDFRLDAPPGAEVARDDDGAFDGDAYALELFVVVGNAEVDVNERRGDVAVNCGAVAGGERTGVLI